MRSPALPILLVVLALGLAFAACSRGDRGPVAIAYDHEACTHCHMLIGDPRYAAQLITTEGDVRSFDDPGCLLVYLAEQHPHVRALWFRDSRADRWLSGADTRFLPGAQTPMGWGFAAVPAGTPGALSLDEATARLAEVARRPR